MKKLSCQITSTFWLMGTSWEAYSLKSNTLYRSDEVGLSVSQERISFTVVLQSLASCLFFFFFFLPHARDICSGKHVLRKHTGALRRVRPLPPVRESALRAPWQRQGLRDLAREHHELGHTGLQLRAAGKC